MPKPETKCTKPGRPESAGPLQSFAANPGLTPLQQLVADEVADMLLFGGDRAAVDLLLRSAAAHSAKRRLAYLLPDEPAEFQKHLEKLVERSLSEWPAELAGSWRRNRAAAPPERPEPRTVTQRIREAVIGALRFHFEIFIGQGTPEEHTLLRDILRAHEEGSSGRSGFEELVLAEAFHFQIDQKATHFLRVPDRLYALVQHYLQCVEAAKLEEPKAAA